ncbi:MAG: YscQ/HrcQ family type III secretion apparatus protein [Chlamydiae bacterium]|nr:YscQ/HrcQ family type III secretion apparatus protein [Chlamydiota bacterium]
MNTRHEHWIKQIVETHSQPRQIPMWGSFPTFDYDIFAKNLSSSLGMQNIHIQPSTPEWVSYDQFLTWAGPSSSYQIIKISPWSGQILWIMPQEDRRKLVSKMLSHSELNGADNTKFQEGFYQYLTLQALEEFEALGAYPELHPRLSKEEIFQEDFCTIPMSITVDNSTFYGTLAISDSFQTSLKEHYSNKLPPLSSHWLSNHLDLPLSLQCGSTTLSLREWNQVGIGDCIVLSRCTYDPELHKGSVTICLDHSPIFRAKIKKNNLKILDYAYYHEEEKSMDSNETLPPEEGYLKDEFSDEHSFFDADEDKEENEHLWSEEGSTKASAEAIISTQDIPLTLVVEVDKIKMNLDKLLQLAPGNVLELSVKPEQGVSITVGGKKVAHAELIKLGDILGVKILKMSN